MPWYRFLLRIRVVVSFTVAAVCWPAPTTWAQTTVFWQNNANGQEIDCNGSEDGGVFFYPDNNLWSQDQRLGTDPCGNLNAVLEPSNWSTTQFPTNGSGGTNYDVVISGSGPAQLDVSVTIDSLTLSGSGTLEILGGRTLTIAEGVLTNDSLLTINSNDTTITTTLFFESDALLDGGGEVFLNRHVNHAQIDAALGATLTQAATHTIRGTGRIIAALVNHGVVQSAPGATTSGLQLMGFDKTNNHIIRAAEGTLIEISGITLTQDDTSGRIIGDQSDVQIFAGANVVNGRLETVGTGTIFTTGIATLTDVTNEGAYNLFGGSSITVAGSGLTNNGTLTVNSNNTSVGTTLFFENDALLDGTGEVVLNRHVSHALIATATDAILTQAPTHTIRGTGQISAALVNNGLIQSAPGATTSGLQLAINDKTNNHIIRAAEGAEIEINGITLTQDAAAGRIIGDQSDVQIFAGANVVNGRLETVGAGTIFTTGIATLTDVTNEGTYNTNGGSTLHIAGNGLTNNGTLTVNSNNTSVGTTLFFEIDALLDGTGEVVLNRHVSHALIDTATDAILTQAATHTIRGTGQISAALVNNGLIQSAAGANTTGLLLQGSDKTNNNIIRAADDVGITINGITLTQDDASGRIIADESDVVIQGGTNLVGGRLETVGAGAFLTTGVATLTNVTSEGTFNTLGGSTLTIAGDGLTNNGTITVNSNNVAATTTLLFNDNTMLDGTGEIVLNRFSTNSQINTGADATLTQTAGHTIRGSGSINAALVNNGLVEADVQTSGNVLRLTSQPKTNNHIFRANVGAELEILGVQVTQHPNEGRIIANEGNVEIFSGAEIIDGTLESVGSGVFLTTGTATLTDVTNESEYGVLGGSTLTIGGSGLTNNGKLTVNSNATAAVTTLLFDGDTLLDGSGEVVLNRLSNNAQINTSAGKTLTQAAGHTIRGTGRIAAALVNNGIIQSAPGSNSTGLQLQGSDKTNNSIIRAADGVRIDISGITITQDDASGQIIGDESNVQLSAGAQIVGGRLDTVGAGTISTTGTATLTNVANEGTFNILGGSTLTIGGAGLINHGALTVNSGSTAATTVLALADGSVLDGTGSIVLNNTTTRAQLSAPSGATVIQQADHMIAGAGQINPNIINHGRLEGASDTLLLEINGTVSGDGVLKDVRIDGTHSPGLSPAAVTVEGVYDFSNTGALEIEIGGLTPGAEFDQVLSTGSVFLDGSLEVEAISLGNAYLPHAGDRFEIINSTSAITGTFDFANLPESGFGHKLTWEEVDYATDPTKVFLEIASVDFLEADFDEDGDVDPNDLDAWESGFGAATAATHGDGDANADEAVNGRDVLTWLRQYGAGNSPAVAAVGVPEPSTGTIALLLMGLSLSARRGQK